VTKVSDLITRDGVKLMDLDGLVFQVKDGAVVERDWRLYQSRRIVGAAVKQECGCTLYPAASDYGSIYYEGPTIPCYAKKSAAYEVLAEQHQKLAADAFKAAVAAA
jgi:hypothetical protein